MNNEYFTKERRILFGIAVGVAVLGLIASLLSRHWIESILWVIILISDFNLNSVVKEMLFWKASFYGMKEINDEVFELIKGKVEKMTEEPESKSSVTF